MPWFGFASVLTALSLVAAACSGAAGHDGDGHGEPPSTAAAGAVRVEELLGYGRADPPAGVFVDVSAGRFRTCGVRDDGALVCWGEAVGEIPEGRFTRVDIVDYGDDRYSSDAPVADGYGCAVRVNGSLACWGDDGVEPLEPPAEDFVDVSVHERAACALTAAGGAACWGDLAPQADGAVVEGDFVEVFAGQVPCALGSEGNLVCWGQEVLHLMPDPPEGRFVDLSMTHGYACAVRVDSGLVCWSPWSSSLMDGYRSAEPQGDGFAAVSVGSGHACALRTDGPVVCWGLNRFGQVDPFDPEEGEAALGRDPLAGPYVQVSVNAEGGWADSSCAVRDTAAVVCWGYVANRGSKGYDDSWLGGSRGSFSQVAASDTTACGLRTDGTVSCWGRLYVEGASPPSGRFVDISAGAREGMCAVREDGELICWNPDREGVQELGGGFVDVSTGAEVCAVRTDATAWCWGGFGVFASRPPQGAFVRVEAGQYISANLQQRPCGIRTDGSIHCWGFQGVGEPPPSVGPLQQASVRFSANWPGGRSCGVRVDGTLACWLTLISDGRNDLAWTNLLQVPRGTYTQVSGTTKTDYTPCAIRTDGTVHCWSWAGPSPEPPPPGRFKLISVERRHGCGIRTDGSLACWGSNHEPPWQPPRPD